MECLSEHILSLFHKKELVKRWINKEYLIKPIIIYGTHGSGKTRLSEYILRSFSTIVINSENAKTGMILDEYLSDTIEKKSIAMMFKDKNPTKALIFDDLDYIHKNDKKLFKSIINFSKRKIHNPIIYVTSSIQQKDIEKIYGLCYPIQIRYTPNRFKYIIKNYLSNIELNDNDLDQLITKSEYNINFVKTNLSFHEKKVENIQVIDHKKEGQTELIKQIIYSPSLDDSIQLCLTDYSKLCLDILENTCIAIQQSKRSKKWKNETINYIYSMFLYGDVIQNNPYLVNLWDMAKYTVILSLLPAKIVFNDKKIKLKKIIHNKYISKCIIYTHHEKVLNQSGFSTDYISLIYSLDKLDVENPELKKIIHKFKKYMKEYY